MPSRVLPEESPRGLFEPRFLRKILILNNESTYVEIDDKLIVSTNFLAEILGVTNRMIYKYRDAGMPFQGKGKIHLPTAVQWLLDKKRYGESRDINEQRQALYREQTEGHQLNNAKARGELLTVGAVREAMYELGVIFTTQVDAAEPRIAADHPESAAAVRREMKLIRETTAEYVRTFANSRDASRDHPAPAGS